MRVPTLPDLMGVGWTAMSWIPAMRTVAPWTPQTEA